MDNPFICVVYFNIGDDFWWSLFMSHLADHHGSKLFRVTSPATT